MLLRDGLCSQCTASVKVPGNVASLRMKVTKINKIMYEHSSKRLKFMREKSFLHNRRSETRVGWEKRGGVFSEEWCRGSKCQLDSQARQGCVCAVEVAAPLCS